MLGTSAIDTGTPIAVVPSMTNANLAIGSKVTYKGRPCVVTRVAKPLEFWITPGGGMLGHVETEDAFDVLTGDDADAFDGDFYPRVQASNLRAR